MPETIFTQVHLSDSDSIKGLLAAATLPNEDFVEHLPHFWVARQNGSVVGAIGLEPYGDAGLLRSLVVAPVWQGQGIAHSLCRQMFAYAHSLGIEHLYLLTTTAETFFPKVGFSVVERDCVPPTIQRTTEFLSLCPSSAVCMAKSIIERT